jgi:N-acetyl-anhydromuramyl-L-alanine amidase AmpD
MVKFNTEFLLPKKYFDGEMIPEGIIWHGMSAINAHELFPAIQPGDDPFDVGVNIAILKHYSYSAQLIIDRKGEPFQLVPFSRKARHAGISLLNGRPKCNDWTIGIEFLTLFKTTKEHGPAYTQPQIKTGLEVRDWLMKEFGIPMANQGGHDEVRAAAIKAGLTDSQGDPPKAKPDPGKEFPWELFRPAPKRHGYDETQLAALEARRKAKLPAESVDES